MVLGPGLGLGSGRGSGRGSSRAAAGKRQRQQPQPGQRQGQRTRMRQRIGGGLHAPAESFTVHRRWTSTARPPPTPPPLWLIRSACCCRACLPRHAACTCTAAHEGGGCNGGGPLWLPAVRPWRLPACGESRLDAACWQLPAAAFSDGGAAPGATSSFGKAEEEGCLAAVRALRSAQGAGIALGISSPIRGWDR